MRTRAPDVLRQLANVFGIAGGISINVLPQLRGQEVGQVARQSEPLLAAEGWAFAIWGLIFAWTAVYAMYQALPSQRENPTLRSIGWLTALNGVLGGVWTLLFTQRLFTAAVIVIVAMLVNLVLIDMRLGNEARRGVPLFIVRAPFSINLGWIGLAVILNVTQWLHVVVGWSGAPLTPEVWSVVMVVTAALLGLAMAHVRRNLGFALVVIWGLAGIADKVEEHSRLVSTVAVASGLVLSFILVAEAIRSRSSASPSPGARPALH